MAPAHRSLPGTATDPFSYYTSHAYVRDFVEAATDASPMIGVGHSTYATILTWCGVEYVPIKCKSRLAER